MARMETVGAAITANSRRASGIAGNMSAADANAASGFESFVKASVMPDGQGGYRYGSVKVETRQTIVRSGEIVGSETSTHIAIKGEGFIPVIKKGNEEVLLTRLGTFEVASTGDLVNEQDMTLMGWRLDDEGRLPGENGNSNTKASAEIASLEIVNIKSLSGKVKATANIALDMRLNSETDTILGSGQTFKFLDASVNKDLGLSDVIIPSQDGIALGDSIKIKVGDGTEETYVYGGVSSSFNIKKIPMLGSNDPTKTFQSQATADETHGVLGDKIRVTVGTNQAVDLVFGNGASSNNNTFNSLTSLCTVLNNIPGLTARIENNTLYIGALDGVSGVTFADVGPGGSNFTRKIGLYNIDSAPNGERRFSTMGQLEKSLDLNPDLRIIKNPDGGLSITSLDPTSGILFTGNSQRSVPIKFVAATQPGGGLPETDNRKITIMSPQNGLKKGDFVKLEGLDTTGNLAAANITEDGLYVVLDADDAGFTIAANASVVVQNAVAGGPAAAGKKYTAPVTGDAKWTKMPGKAEAPITVTAAGARRISYTNATNKVTIDNGAGNPFNGIVADDMVYVSGIGLDNTITVPDGYYRVLNAGGQTLEIEVLGTGLAADVAAVATTKNYTVQKVGTGAGSVISGSVSLEKQGATNIVRVYMPDHGFSQDDYFRFTGAAINGVATGKNYKIVSTDANYFEFDAGSDAGSLDAQSLGADNYVDCFSKLDQAIGFRQDKDSLSLDAAFSPQAGSGANLAVKKFDGVFEQVITVYDSLGSAHSFNMAFAKTGQQKWAVQMFTNEKNVVDNADDGIVASGVIEFDGFGVLKSVEGLDDVLIKWNNGATSSKLKFDMGATADDESTAVFTTGGVKQLAGTSQLFSVENDGYGVGKFVSVNIDSTSGRIIATYDNGQTMPIYMLPLCFVAAPDELEAAGGNAYRTTNTSGAIILKRTGDDGVGSYEGQAIEKSNIDTTEQMSGLAQVAQQSAMQASVFQMLKQMNEEFIRRT